MRAAKGKAMIVATTITCLLIVTLLHADIVMADDTIATRNIKVHAPDKNLTMQFNSTHYFLDIIPAYTWLYYNWTAGDYRNYTITDPKGNVTLLVNNMTTDKYYIQSDTSETINITVDGLSAPIQVQYGEQALYNSSGINFELDVNLIFKRLELFTNTNPNITGTTPYNENGNENTLSLPTNQGESITFAAYGADYESNGVQLRVCSNEPNNWSNCTVICQNLTFSTFTSNLNNNATCTYDTADVESTTNTFYAIVRDLFGLENISAADSYYVNQPPQITDYNHSMSNLSSDYTFNDTMEYINVTVLDDEDTGANLDVTLRLVAPNGSVIIDDVAMSHVSSGNYNYIPTRLDAIGVWNMTFCVSDPDGLQQCNETNPYVAATDMEIISKSLRLLNITNDNQTWYTNFEISEPSGQDVTQCGLLINGTTNETGVFNTNTKRCTLTINRTLDTTLYNFSQFALDDLGAQYNGSWVYSLTASVYNMTVSSRESNLSDGIWVARQYNLTNRNATQWNNTDWIIDTTQTESDTITILANRTRLYAIDYKLAGNSTIRQNLSYDEQGSGIYTVDEGYRVYRYFWINYSQYATLGDLPSITVYHYNDRYASGDQTLYFDGDTQTVSESEKIPITTGTFTGNANRYGNLSYYAKLVYSSQDSINYTRIDNTLYYSFNDGNGKQINFLFDHPTFPINASTKIVDDINYSELDNWQNKTSSSSNIEDQDGNDIGTQSFTDNLVQQKTEIEWFLESGDTSYIYNLQWAVPADTFACDDNIDNDGDGKSDENDEGCYSDGNISNSESYLPQDNDERYCGDFVVDSNEQCDAGPSGSSSCSSSCTSIGGGGGGGGGSLTIITGDASKEQCDIVVSPSTITLTDDQTVQVIEIRNNEDSAYSPTIEFRTVENSIDLRTKLRATNAINDIFAQEQQATGIQYIKTFLSNENISGEAKVALVDDQCKDIELPIRVNVTSTTQIGDLLGGEGSILERFSTFLNAPVSDKVPFLPHWVLVIFAGIISALVTIPITWVKKNPIANVALKVSAWIILLTISSSVLIIGLQIFTA